MRNSSWLLASLLAAAGPAYAIAAPPGEVQITFDILRNGSEIAEADFRLEHDGHTYRIVEVWRGRGLLSLRGTVTRTSRGRIDEDGLKPLEFTDERTGLKTARATFDWKARTVTQRYKGEPRTEPMPPHADDRVSYLFDLAFARLLPKEVEFDLFDGRGQSHHVYNVGATERVTTPAGVFDAVKLWRGTEHDRTEIYLATGRSYLPVLMRVVNPDGSRFEQLASKISEK